MSEAGTKRHSNERITEALRSQGGIIAAAAQVLRVSRQTLYVWIRAEPELQALVAELRDEILDLAEGQLLKAVKDGSERSVHFMLKTIGRERGYGDKIDLAGTVTNEVKRVPNFEGWSQDDRDALRDRLERRAREPE